MTGQDDDLSEEEIIDVAGLAERWRFSRATVEMLAANDDFPEPVFFEGDGCEEQAWRLSDIEDFEKDYPELLYSPVLYLSRR